MNYIPNITLIYSLVKLCSTPVEELKQCVGRVHSQVRRWAGTEEVMKTFFGLCTGLVDLIGHDVNTASSSGSTAPLDEGKEREDGNTTFFRLYRIHCQKFWIYLTLLHIYMKVK